MGKLVLTKNYKNIMNSYWSSTSSYLYFNKGVKDENGTEYQYSGIFRANMSAGVGTFSHFATWGAGVPGSTRKRITPSSGYEDYTYFDIGYESTDPTEDSYVIDRTAASVSVASVENSTIKKLYTITNNSESDIVINCIGSYIIMVGSDTYQSSGTTINVLLSAYKFDDITIPANGSATILCDFE